MTSAEVNWSSVRWSLFCDGPDCDVELELKLNTSDSDAAVDFLEKIAAETLVAIALRLSWSIGDPVDGEPKESPDGRTHRCPKCKTNPT